MGAKRPSSVGVCTPVDVRYLMALQVLERAFKQPALHGRSLFLFGSHSRFRIFCNRVVHNKCEFSILVLVLNQYVADTRRCL